MDFVSERLLQLVILGFLLNMLVFLCYYELVTSVLGKTLF